jgi:UDP-2,3-diacylglucosamine hydrolase
LSSPDRPARATSAAPPPPAARLVAPAHWRSVEFIADLHLCAELPRTAAALLAHLGSTDADAVFLLGDIFEAWVGDDMAEPAAQAGATFEHDFSLHLADLARRRWIGFMVGNRDFLVGPRWLARCAVHALADPTLLLLGDTFPERQLLLSHGDALCLADTDYQRFRAEVRGSTWQRTFLARPLAERLALARQMRQASRARQAGQTPGDAMAADVDHPAALAWLQAAGADTLVHGHTHRPARHLLGTRADGRSWQRLVLSDWHLDGDPPPPADDHHHHDNSNHPHGRAEVLRLDASGWQRRPPLGTA